MNNNFLPVKTLPDKSLNLRRAFAVQDFEQEKELIEQYIKKECFINVEQALIVCHFSDDKALDKKIKYLDIFKSQLNKQTIITAFTRSTTGFSSHQFARHVWKTPLVQSFNPEEKQHLLKKAAIEASRYYIINKVDHLNNFQSSLQFLIKELGLSFSNSLKREVYNSCLLLGDELSSVAQPILLSIELEKTIQKPKEESGQSKAYYVKGKI